jgi:hypothetical protein
MSSYGAKGTRTPRDARAMMKAPIRLLITIATYLVTITLVASVAFFLVILLAGPHGGLLPRALEGVVLILGWSLVLVLPHDREGRARNSAARPSS